MRKYPLKKYGVWAGNREGNDYKPENCAYSVMHDYLSAQCSRKSGHGKDDLFCKQHAKKIN